MTYSLNEIEALAKKAARGAGYSWGIAEEAGKATRWLASHDLPGLAALAGLLTVNDGVVPRLLAPSATEPVWAAENGVLCPLLTGAALNDYADRLGSGQTIAMTQVLQPLLIVPFAAWAAIHVETPVAVRCGAACLASDGYGLWADTLKDDAVWVGTDDVTVSCVSDLEGPAPPPGLRCKVDQLALKKLDAFAHRTYAPATEESRRLGAGAGVSDND